MTGSAVSAVDVLFGNLLLEWEEVWRRVAPPSGVTGGWRISKIAVSSRRNPYFQEIRGSILEVFSSRFGSGFGSRFGVVLGAVLHSISELFGNKKGTLFL